MPVNYRKLFDNSLLFTVIFPNLRAVSSTNSFQPLTLPLIFADAAIRGRADRHAASFAAVYLVCVLLSFLIHGKIAGATLLYSVLYLSGPLTYFYFIGRGESLSTTLINIGLGFTFLTVAEQFFVASPLAESVISTVFANRPPEVAIGLRGVGGFMSEPSQSGRLYVFLLFLAYLLKCRFRAFWLVMAIPFLLMNRSASAFLLLLALLMVLSYRRSKTFTLVLIGIGAVAFPYFLLIEFRFSEVFERFLLAWESAGNASVVSVLGTAGGRRLIQTAVGFMSLSVYPLGNGIGSSLETFQAVAQSVGFDLSDWSRYEEFEDGLKPSSYAAQIVYDFGWLAVPILAALAFPFRNHRVGPDPLRKMVFLLGAAQILVASPTTIPWPWVMMAVGLVPAEPRSRIPAVQPAPGVA